MVRSQIFLFSFLGMFLISHCTNHNKATQKTAFQNMIDLQEEVRPMIAHVSQFHQELEQLEPTVDTNNRQLLGEIDLAIRALEKAEQRMMAWINVNGGQQIEDLRNHKSHKEIMQYIEEEEQDLLKVKELMLSSIDQSEMLIDKISQ